MNRREFIVGGGAMALAGCGTVPTSVDASPRLYDVERLGAFEAETDLVRPADFKNWFRTGDACGYMSLMKLEAAFQKVMDEVRATKVTTDRPAVWLVYNMGFVVKTKSAVFSIDLNHRRSAELAPLLDFALITHNHDDHYNADFYRAMDRAGKTVVSNFLDNYGAADWKKGGASWYANGGYTRAEKSFRFGDVEVRTSLVDHNAYLVDFTTAFEIRIGDFILYHTGDCGNSRKFKNTFGRPDLWLCFPGCGLNAGEAYDAVRPKEFAFGHLWELGHGAGRLKMPLLMRQIGAAEAKGAKIRVPLWGERVI